MTPPRRRARDRLLGCRADAVIRERDRRGRAARPGARATGRRLISGFGLPLAGRGARRARRAPRPASSAYWIVGSDARMRVSSPITPFFSGTLKSTRTKTRRSFRCRSRMVRLLTAPAGVVQCRRYDHRPASRVDAAARVAPLVVVPGQDLEEVAVHHLGIRRVDDRGVRIAAEVDRHELGVRHRRGCPSAVPPRPP